MLLYEHLKTFPFIAITRGITASEAIDCGTVLIESGFTLLETPLNSPDPLATIALMSRQFAGRALIGAGTVMEVDQVIEVDKAGGKLIISPHCDIEVIRETKRRGLISIPGVATPTEAMAALKAGADALKLFPAEIISAAAVKAMRAILPPQTVLLPVGGIDAGNWQPYYQAGASGFGLGSSLYKVGISATELRHKAQGFALSWKELQKTGAAPPLAHKQCS